MASKEQKIRRNVRRSYVISTMSVALVLFMLGVVSYVTLSMLSAASRLRDNVVVSVEIASEVEESQRKVLLLTIESTTMCHAVAFMSKDEKFADETFRQQHRSQEFLVGVVGKDLLGAVLVNDSHGKFLGTLGGLGAGSHVDTQQESDDTHNGKANDQ